MRSPSRVGKGGKDDGGRPSYQEKSMPFQFSDQHIEEYHMRGLTVFRGILPPSLLSDLRRVTDRAREIAREKHGPQAQRLQPVAGYDLDQRPFEDYHSLSAVREAVTGPLSAQHQPRTR